MSYCAMEVGHVIREANPPVSWWCNHIPVEAENLEECWRMVASGRWVIVEQQPAGEHGPNNEGSNE